MISRLQHPRIDRLLKLRLLPACLLFLLTAVPALAQWSGTIDAAGGIGLRDGLRTLQKNELLHHYLGKGGFDLSYKDSTLIWITSLSGSYESVTKDYLQGDARHFRDYLLMDGLLTLARTNPLTTLFQTEATWQRAPGRSFSVWIQYQFDHIRSDNENNRLSEDMTLDYYGDHSESRNHNIGTGLSFSRQLGSPRRILAASLSFGQIVQKETTAFFTTRLQDPDDRWEDIFRITPRTLSNQVGSVVHFKDSVLTGKVKLVLDPGLRITASSSIYDNSGATASRPIDEKEYDWRDSTALRERFNFYALDIQPYLAAGLTFQNIQFHTDYALMWYARRLSDAHNQGMQHQKPYAVGQSCFSWQMAADHSLSLTNNLSVNHPSYLQVCWFDRTGDYIDRLYRGNPYLKSTVSQKYGLSYTYQHNSFYATGSLSYSHNRNEIVQTWFSEQIDGRQYQIFTWLNGLDSKQVGVEHVVGWDANGLTAKISSGHNHSWRRLQATDTLRRSDDWNVQAELSADLGKGWTISTHLKYQSKITTFFAMLNEYCEVNVRLSKTFNRLTLYYEGRDLADMPKIVHMESADGTQIHVERAYLSRRLFVLGCKWRF